MSFVHTHTQHTTQHTSNNTHTPPTMTALLITAHGEVSNIAIEGRTPLGIVDAYRNIFPSARDVEMHDVYVRLGEVRGTRECMCVFYDSAHESHVKVNPYFVGKTRDFYGGVLAVWTRADLDNTTGRDDVPLGRVLTEDEFKQRIVAFGEDVADFVRRISNPMLLIKYPLFPNIRRFWSKEGGSWYSLNGIDLRSGSREPSPFEGTYDVDLLTRRFKWRTCVISFAYPKSSRFWRAFGEQYRYKFCAGCSKAISVWCSRCGEYYWCGSPDCGKRAWGVHRSDCVAK